MASFAAEQLRALTGDDGVELSIPTMECDAGSSAASDDMLSDGSSFVVPDGPPPGNEGAGAAALHAQRPPIKPGTRRRYGFGALRTQQQEPGGAAARPKASKPNRKQRQKARMLREEAAKRAAQQERTAASGLGAQRAAARQRSRSRPPVEVADDDPEEGVVHWNRSGEGDVLEPKDRRQALDAPSRVFSGVLRDEFKQRKAAVSLVEIAATAGADKAEAILLSHLLAWCAVFREDLRKDHAEGVLEEGRVLLPVLSSSERRATMAAAYYTSKRFETRCVLHYLPRAYEAISNLREFESVCLQSFVHLIIAKGAAEAVSDMTKRVEISVQADTSDWDSRMWKIKRSECMRVIGTHSTECVWKLGLPRCVRGFKGMLRIMRVAGGLSGLYSPGWLRQNGYRVSFMSVLELVGGGPPVPPSGPWDAPWAPWNFPVEHAEGRDPLRGWDIGFAEVHSVLYPWPRNMQGFDNFMSAALYVKEVWGEAGWDLHDAEAHAARVRVRDRPREKMTAMSLSAWSAESRRMHRRQYGATQARELYKAARNKARAKKDREEAVRKALS